MEMYGLVVLEFNRVEAYDTAFAVMATPETGNRYPNDVQPFVQPSGQPCQPGHASGQASHPFTSATRPPPPEATPRRTVQGHSSLWHERMGHPGPDALEHLPEATVGIMNSNIGHCPRGIECEVYAIAKAR